MREQKLTLEIYRPPDHQPEVVAHDPDPATLSETIHKLEWDDLTFVVLKIDDDNGIEVSGALSEDFGLSARFWENGAERVAGTAPTTLDELAALLGSYCSGDNRWREMFAWV